MLLLIQDEKERSKAERLYEQYHSIMLYTAYKILQDASLAEDAVHQAFVKVIQNLHKIDESNCHRTKGFLIVICRNTAYDIYKNKTNLNRDDMLDEVGDSRYDPADFIVNEETFHRIVDEMEKLKPIYYDVLGLKYSQECTNDEIAKLLNISEPLVRKRLERARNQLLMTLRKEELI